MSYEVKQVIAQFEMEKSEPMMHIETIAPDGLGYGNGPIGVVERLNNPEDPLTPEVCKKVEEISTSPECTVDISTENGAPIDYDNCPDGRKTSATVRMNEEGHFVEETLETHTPKAFGGGLTMGVAGLIGNGLAQGTVSYCFEKAGRLFARKRINYGAHTSTHADKFKSDCGAIDNAPIIIKNALDYENDIRGTLDVLFGNDAKNADYQAATDMVFDNYREFVKSEDFQKEKYSGAQVMSGIASSGKIVKVLDESHREVRIRILLDGKGKTSNQSMVREATGGVAQIFAIDVPRMREISNKAFESTEQRKQALISMLVYSLAVSATLTKGDLPADIVYSDIPYIKLDTHEYSLAA